MEKDLNRGAVIDFAEARNQQQLRRKRLEVDLELYQAYLDDCDLSEDAKADFVDALWTVIVAFVDLGYGIHPTQTGRAEVIDLSTARPLLPQSQQRKGVHANV